MSTEDINEMWAVDAKIDQTNLLNESKKIPELHSKYYGLYYKEALKVKKLRYDYKVLRLSWTRAPRAAVRLPRSQ